MMMKRRFALRGRSANAAKNAAVRPGPPMDKREACLREVGDLLASYLGKFRSC